MATRWGIVASGKISSDFVAAVSLLPKSEHKVVAVAARSLDSAKAFAARFGIPKAYGNYQELATDPDVEIVYIGNVQSHHLETAITLAKAKKHILCEKPLCINVRETQELIQVAKKEKVFLMEGVWSRCFPVYHELERRMKNGEIGEVQHVIANFGRDLYNTTPRLLTTKTGGGVTLDIGIYPIQFTLFVFGEKPTEVIASGHKNEAGVDTCTGMTLLFPGGKIASLSASLKADLPSEGHVVGTKGTIKVNFPLWCPESLEGPSGKFYEPVPKTDHQFNFLNSQGLSYEAMEVRRCLKEGLLESPRMPHTESLRVAEVLEKVRKQVGVVYPQDQQ